MELTAQETETKVEPKPNTNGSPTRQAIEHAERQGKGETDTTEQTKEPADLSKWLSGGILIALGTAMAYIWALSYEVGLCNYFHIPFYLISLSPTTILSVSGGILLGTSLMILIFLTPGIIFGPLIRYLTKTIAGFIITYVFLTIMFGVLMLVFASAQWKQWIWGEVFLVLLLAIVFLRPLFTQHGKSSYQEKLRIELLGSQAPGYQQGNKST